jgi:hypothetical protein
MPTTVTRYVDTAATIGGDGQSQAHSNDAQGHRAYKSLSEWEAGEQKDLVTADEIHEVYCAGSSRDTIACTVAGWNDTGPSNYVLIAGDPAAPDNDGANPNEAFSEQHYRIGGIDGHALTMSINSWRMQDFQIDHQSPTNGRAALRIVSINPSNGTVDMKLWRSRIRWNAAETIANHDAIQANDPDIVLDIRNCVVEWDRGGSAEAAALFDCNVTVFNSVFTGADQGIQINGGTAAITNCALFDNDDDFFDNSGGTASITIDHCASDDGDGADAVDISPGASEADGWNDAFTDYANGDYSIRNAASVLADAGTAGGPAADILGDAYGTADIGAFAWQLSAAPSFPAELLKARSNTLLRL